ncbi:MAG: DNA-protecting protein DprA, partial [Microbacterium chocolatum]|nr:DNA-protecting protein DprA [Microbacterium chocolatum]
GPVTSAASAGCHRLLREYDAVCVTGVDDVADLIGALPADSPSERASPGESSVDSDSRRVRDALSSRTPRSVTAIARHTGLAEADVAGRLGMLELEGRARRVLDGWLRGG